MLLRLKAVADAGTEYEYECALERLAMSTSWQESTHLHVWFEKKWLAHKEVKHSVILVSVAILLATVPH